MKDFSEGQVTLFIGAEIPVQFKSQIRECREVLSHASWLQWVNPQNLHLTVFYMGTVKEDILENLLSLFRLGYQSCSPITLQQPKWDWGPTKKDPRMVWLRFPKSEEFSSLVMNSRDWFGQVQSLPQQRRRPVPHVTIARFKPTDKDPATLLPLKQVAGSWKVHSLTLWKSEPAEDGGMVYTPIETFRLGRRK